MPSIPVEQPRVKFPNDLTGYLNRQTDSINRAFSEVNYFVPKTILPARVRIGEVHYFSAAIPTTAITGEGLWIYKSTGWTLIV